MYGLRRSLSGLRTLSCLRGLQPHELGRGVHGSGQVRQGERSLVPFGWISTRWPRWKRGAPQALAQTAAVSERKELSVQEEEVKCSDADNGRGCGLQFCGSSPTKLMWSCRGLFMRPHVGIIVGCM